MFLELFSFTFRKTICSVMNVLAYIGGHVVLGFFLNILINAITNWGGKGNNNLQQHFCFYFFFKRTSF